jgi:hypothetical protein
MDTETMRFVVFSLALLALSGCRTLMDPNFLPSGYTYHNVNHSYKAPPGPAADDIGYDYSFDQNAAVLTIWAEVARDLLNQIEERTGLGAQDVYLERLPEHNAFNASFDDALRAELRSRGYVLADAPQDRLHLRYGAFLPEDENARRTLTYNDDPEIPMHPENRDKPSGFIVVLTALHNGIVLDEARGIYDMPAYGYVSGAGRIDVAPLMKASR